MIKIPGIHQYSNKNPAICAGCFNVSKYVMSENTVHITVKKSHDNNIENTTTIADNVFFMMMILI